MAGGISDLDAPPTTHQYAAIGDYTINKPTGLSYGVCVTVKISNGVYIQLIKSNSDASLFSRVYWDGWKKWTKYTGVQLT